MPWYAVAALDDALDATKSLLTPLDAGQWLRFALVALVPVRAFVRHHALLVLGEAEPQFDLLPGPRRELRERS